MSPKNKLILTDCLREAREAELATKLDKKIVE